MSGLFGLFTSEKEKKVQAFSLDKLHVLYQRLQQLKQPEGKDREENREQIVEAIRQIAEALIWGEKNDSSVFDYFCEKNILADFVHVLGLSGISRAVKVQLLQTLSILIQNISRETSLYYLFSNNYVNVLINTKFDWKDEEIVAYYVNLLKSLSLRLNRETIKFFLCERQDSFPLYTEAIRFFNHREQMVCAAIRTLTLQVYKVDDDAVKRFVLLKGEYYFTHLACHLRRLWVALNNVVIAPGANERVIESGMNQVEDLHLYMRDLMDAGVKAVGMPSLTDILSERLLVYALFPFLLGSLVRGATAPAASAALAPADPAATAASSKDHTILSRTVALFLLQRVIHSLAVKPLLGPLAKLLTERQIGSAMSAFVYGPPPQPPPSYYELNWGGGQSPHGSSTTRFPSTSIHLPPADDGVTLLTNPFRTKLTKAITSASSSDVELLLSTAVLYAMLTSRNIARNMLEEAGLIPPPDRGGRKKSQDIMSLLITPSDADSARSPTCQGSVGTPVAPDLAAAAAMTGASAGGPPSSGTPSTPGTPRAAAEAGAVAAVTGEEEKGAGDALNILLMMCQAFQRYQQLRVITILVLQRTLMEMLLAQPLIAPQWMMMILESVNVALRGCARDLRRDHFQGALGDYFLDLFLEQWDVHLGPLLDVSAVMNDTRALTPGPVDVSSDGLSRGPGGDHIAMDWVTYIPGGTTSVRTACSRHIRVYLILRRLHRALVQLAQRKDTSRASYIGSIQENVPIDFSMDLNGYAEGRSVDLGRMDRVICGIVGPTGKNTRYLVKNPQCFLLVQPDLSCAGWGIIRTICPIRCVDAMIDRSDPRTLCIYITATSCPPGEATLAESQSEGHPVYQVVLSFEDARRCHCAQAAIEADRTKVRVGLMEQLDKLLLSSCCDREPSNGVPRPSPLSPPVRAKP